MPHVVVGTAGHIDHGKTALVKALTGTDTDRLAEEKKRGMTIDLGFAFLNESISITDVPGHEKFVRNMVAGVSTIHMALIVIAADDGIMPQTREHLQILELLGIEYAVIALTKIDIIKDPEWIDLVEEEIEDILSQTRLKGSPVIRTSVVTGEGLDELKSSIISRSEEIRVIADRGFFRMPVDRVFSKPGFGTIVTGTVMSGVLSTGDHVNILPEGLGSKVRGIQSHGFQKDKVTIGDRAAINLAGLDPKTIYRGSEVSQPGFTTASNQFIVNMTLIPDSPWELKNRQKVHLHLGTAETLAVVSGLKQSLKPGGNSNLVLTTAEYVAGAVDDRLIIRSYSPVNTIGGGLILSVHENETRRNLHNLASRLPVDLFERFTWLVKHHADEPVSVTGWSKRLNQSEQLVKTFVENAGFALEKTRGLVYDRNQFSDQKKSIISLLKKYFKENVLRTSMNLEQIRKTAGFSAQLFEYLVERMVSENQIKKTPAGLSLPGYKIKLSEKDHAAINSLKAFIHSQGFTLVSKNDLLEKFNFSEDNLNSYLHFLKENQKIYEIESNSWVATGSLEEMKKRLMNFFSTDKELDVAGFKKLSGLTRKSAIPWLEFLDKYNLTERSGDSRIKGKQLP